MNTAQRQQLISVLAKSSLSDIKKYWKQSLEDFDYSTLRQPQTGMVMAVARTEAKGEPFNLGEVSVTRCALRLSSGETGIGYVMGSNKEHALHVAMLDAIAQQQNQYAEIHAQVIQPLQQKFLQTHQKQQQKTDSTRVDFFTMVRGED
jgi:alpha-D-ribose 1-methylphosphonate 5-triphosphate synthase subunit PhnG